MPRLWQRDRHRKLHARRRGIASVALSLRPQCNCANDDADAAFSPSALGSGDRYIKGDGLHVASHDVVALRDDLPVNQRPLLIGVSDVLRVDKRTRVLQFFGSLFKSPGNLHQGLANEGLKVHVVSHGSNA